MLLVGISLAVAPVTVASAAKHKTTHHKAKAKAKHGASTSKVASRNCPKASTITAAAGTAYTGPAATNGGTAACVYNDTAGDELNYIVDSPNESRSEFVKTDPSDIGEPAQAVSGIGAAAFATTTYGHAEIDVYVSSSKGFAVTLDPANQAAVTTADLTQVEAVARAVLKG